MDPNIFFPNPEIKIFFCGFITGALLMFISSLLAERFKK